MLIFLFSLLSLRLTAKKEILAIGLRVVSSNNLMSGLRGSGFDVLFECAASRSSFGVRLRGLYMWDIGTFRIL